MKARIKATGAIVDVFYNAFSGLWTARENTNIKYLEDNLEFLEEKDIDWEERRFELIKSAIQGFCANSEPFIEQEVTFNQLAAWSIEMADVIIAELRKGGER